MGKPKTKKRGPSPDQKQARLDAFAREYVLDHNITQAAIRAGFSVASAHTLGSRAFKDVACRNKIAELEAAVTKDTAVKVGAIVREAEQIALFDLGSVLEQVGDQIKVKDLKDLPTSVLKKFRLTTLEKDGVKISRLDVEAHDKLKAMSTILRHYGALKDVVRFEDEQGRPLQAQVTCPVPMEELLSSVTSWAKRLKAAKGNEDG